MKRRNALRWAVGIVAATYLILTGVILWSAQDDAHKGRTTVVCVPNTHGTTSDCGYSDNGSNGDR